MLFGTRRSAPCQHSWCGADGQAAPEWRWDHEGEPPLALSCLSALFGLTSLAAVNQPAGRMNARRRTVHWCGARGPSKTCWSSSVCWRSCSCCFLKSNRPTRPWCRPCSACSRCVRGRGAAARRNWGRKGRAELILGGGGHRQVRLREYAPHSPSTMVPAPAWHCFHWKRQPPHSSGSCKIAACLPCSARCG